MNQERERETKRARADTHTHTHKHTHKQTNVKHSCLILRAFTVTLTTKISLSYLYLNWRSLLSTFGTFLPSLCFKIGKRVEDCELICFLPGELRQHLGAFVCQERRSSFLMVCHFPFPFSLLSFCPRSLSKENVSLFSFA